MRKALLIIVVAFLLALSSCSFSYNHPVGIPLTIELTPDQQELDNRAAIFYGIAKTNARVNSDHAKAAENYCEAAKLWAEAELNDWARSAFCSASEKYAEASKASYTIGDYLKYHFKSSEALAEAEKLDPD